MFKGLGFFAMFVFVLLSIQMGGMGPGFGVVFISILFVAAGVLAFSFLQFPEPLDQGKAQALLDWAKIDVRALAEEIEELAMIIRRDGLLVAENFRKNLKDKKLQYLMKRSMDGFEKKQVTQWLESQSAFQLEQFVVFQNYLDRVLSIIPVVGLLGSVFQFMHQPVSLASAFVPFVVALVSQLLLQALVQERINSAKRKTELYFAILEEGMVGIMDGVTSEFIREQLFARMGIPHARPGQAL